MKDNQLSRLKRIANGGSSITHSVYSHKYDKYLCLLMNMDDKREYFIERGPFLNWYIMSKYDITPKIYDISPLGKFTLCDLLDRELTEKEFTNPKLAPFVRKIIDLFVKERIIHGDLNNIKNWMWKDDQIYVIDYDFSIKIEKEEDFYRACEILFDDNPIY